MEQEKQNCHFTLSTQGTAGSFHEASQDKFCHISNLLVHQSFAFDWIVWCKYVDTGDRFCGDWHNASYQFSPQIWSLGLIFHAVLRTH